MIDKAGSDALARAARLVQIIALVQGRNESKRGIGRPEIARTCGCNVRTLARDLDLLREIAPINWDPAQRSYVLTDPRWRFPVNALTAEDVLALCLARGLLSAPGYPQSALLRRTFDTLLRGIPPALNALLQSDDAPDFPGLPRDYSAAPIDVLTRAVHERRTLEIDYESRSSAEGERRRLRAVDPYQVAPRDGIFWELHGWCHRNQAVRTFALDRIHSVRSCDATFVRREADWAAFLEDRAVAIGPLTGGDGEAFVVDVRFDAAVADYVRDQRWPRTLAVKSDVGGVRLHGTTPNVEAMVVALLRWRRFARVVGGRELRAAYRDELRAMLAANGEGESSGAADEA